MDPQNDVLIDPDAFNEQYLRDVQDYQGQLDGTAHGVHLDFALPSDSHTNHT